MTITKFKLGQLMATPGVIEAVPQEEIGLALQRHAKGDWGTVCNSDKAANDFAVDHEERLLSAYETADTKVKFWVITEWDRSLTTVLLPDEY